jgi:hypothetical protein
MYSVQGIFQHHFQCKKVCALYSIKYGNGNGSIGTAADYVRLALSEKVRRELTLTVIYKCSQ